jgi:hypothetical protein
MTTGSGRGHRIDEREDGAGDEGHRHQQQSVNVMWASV